MLFFKPAWVNHEDNKPIFSVDIHPKGGRFVTGGQGGAGGRIVIWNISPVLDENDELDPKIPKMLCQMDNHLACVNVVRWSTSGHLLASGGDDKLVMIWRLTNEGSSSVFGSGKVNIETWKCIHTLSAHNGDVLDVAWAPHDGWLASCSVDNAVIIWNAQKFPEKISVLKSHTGMVKGVTWDPVGKYIASQSDDKSLRIFRTSDWTQEEVVTEPFVECSATTHVLRLSWSPDGQYLVSAHAMNGGGPTAQIIEREGWRQDKDFVGHRKAVTCVRFNSNILKKSTKENKKPTQYCCCAIGSRDRSISVWLTSLKRPLVVIKDIFDDSVLDLSWSSDGLYLFACSWDGTVACIVFNQDEIGTPLSMEEKNALYERVYHKSLQRSWNMNLSCTQIVENPEILEAVTENENKPTSLTVDVQEPQLVTPPVSRDVIFDVSRNQSILVPANKQVETRLPSGKRRITPMLLTTVSKESGADLLQISTNYSPETFSKSSPSKSQIVVETIKQQPPKVFKPESTNQKQKELNKVVSAPPPGIHINQLMCSEVPGDEPIIKLVNVMDPLKLASGVTVIKDCGVVKLQVTNNCIKTQKGSLSRIELFKTVTDKEPKWETYLGSSIRCVATNRKLCVTACEDLTINCFELKSGARFLPPVLIEDLACTICLSQGGFCLVLTKTGLIHMWDLENSKSILSRVSVRSLLTGKGTVNSCVLSDKNQPIITLTDGRAYAYSMDLQTWVQLSNPLDSVGGIGGAFTKRPPSNLPLASLQKMMPMYKGIDNLSHGAKLSFLENQLTASRILESSMEYKHWLMATVDHLLEKGPECRLRLILDDLMGPNNASAKKRKVDDIMGLSRKALLKEILSTIKTRLPWQRLYREYNEQLVDEQL